MGSDQMTWTALEPMMGHVFAMLKRHAPPSLLLDYDHDRDAGIDRHSTSVSLPHGCRPSSYYMMNGRLVLGGEEKVTCTTQRLTSLVLLGMAVIHIA